MIFFKLAQLTSIIYISILAIVIFLVPQIKAIAATLTSTTTLTSLRNSNHNHNHNHHHHQHHNGDHWPPKDLSQYLSNQSEHQASSPVQSPHPSPVNRRDQLVVTGHHKLLQPSPDQQHEALIRTAFVVAAAAAAAAAAAESETQNNHHHIHQPQLSFSPPSSSSHQYQDLLSPHNQLQEAESLIVENNYHRNINKRQEQIASITTSLATHPKQQSASISSPQLITQSASPPALPPPVIEKTKTHQLMIGQHYNNFSSIVPYSIVQDSDYNSPGDLLLQEEEEAALERERLHLASNNQNGDSNGGGNSGLLTLTSKANSVGRRTITTDVLRKQQNANSRALLPLDSNRLILPQMQQIKSRFNQGCVGGTKCQFFAFCWMSGGSLGASCGLLMTCCVTPSRQEIQPGFYGPVVNDPYCGRSTSKINRIVGGTDASFGQFPWQAFVQVGGSRCGGALISSRHVVTAGHCVARSQHSPSSIKVTLGDYILNSDIESIPHEVFSVVEVLLHPNFRFTPQADRYDVAVLELDRTASYKDNIKPICLPQKDATFVGRVAYVAGWGALQAGSKLRPKVLQHVAVPVIENNVCESWHRRKGIDIRIYDEMMCAGYELGQRDACQGDSGGPLMLNQYGVWYLVGIVSAGYSCAKQYQPGIYHRVSSSSDWISSNIYQQGANK